MNKLKKLFDYLLIILATIVGYTMGNVIHASLVIIDFIFALFRIKFMVKIVIIIWSNMLFWTIGKRLYIKGKENIEKGKNYIYIVNHSSLFDIPALMSLKPDIAWVGKPNYAKIPIFGHLLRLNGYISIKREDFRRAKMSIDIATEKAAKNVSIGFFPEGTRTLTGEIQKFKRGFVIVLRSSNLDILPITFNGFYQLKPKKRFHIDPKPKLEIIIHKPLRNEDLIKMKDHEIVTKVQSIIEADYKIG